MVSRLVIIPVDGIQEKINNIIKGYDGMVGVYVSLNKSQGDIEKNLLERGISTNKIFFIDCVSNKVNEENLNIHPKDTEDLLFSIECLLSKINAEKFLIIDALSTLLIYNDQNKVARFVMEVTKKSSNKLNLIAFSPKTEEELLNKIFNFFDDVEKIE